MQIPGWVHDQVIYPRARAAILSMFTAPRFYGPATAAALFETRKAPYDRIHLIRREDGIAIWETPAGELATMATELPTHLANLLSEFTRNQYVRKPLELKPGAIVLDVGANIGLFTLQAVRAGARRVISLEPNPETRKALEWNVAKRGAANVRIIPKGAWKVKDTLQMTVDPFRPGRSSIVVPAPERAAYSVAVELVPLDELATSLGLQRIDFLKMDIEGAEDNALLGAADILKRFQPQLSIAVEHTENRLDNARRVRDIVLGINPKYKCTPGPYTIMPDRRLAPDILFFR